MSESDQRAALYAAYLFITGPVRMEYPFGADGPTRLTYTTHRYNALVERLRDALYGPDKTEAA